MKISKLTLLKLYSSCAIESSIWAFSCGPVCRYFMELLGKQYPETCNTILGIQSSCQVALAALVQATVSVPYITSRVNCLDWFKRHFAAVLLIDSVIFTIISLLSEEAVIIRFLGFAIFSTVTSQIWNLVSGNQINRLFTGEELTRFNARLSCIRQAAAFAGGLSLIAVGNNLSVGAFIDIQVIMIWLIALLDYSTFSDIEKNLEK